MEIKRIGYSQAFTMSFSAWWRGSKGHRIRELSNPFFWYDFLKHIVPATKCLINKNISGLTLKLENISFSMDPTSQIYDQTIIVTEEPVRMIQACPRCENVHHNVSDDLFWCDCTPIQVNHKGWKKYIKSLNKPYYEGGAYPTRKRNES